LAAVEDVSGVRRRMILLTRSAAAESTLTILY
jgi:hypothetical protein